MNYPLISEYVEAIRSAEDNFNKLSNLRPILDVNGDPIMSSGHSAVVFKMEDIETNKLYAVKCFYREQEEREERYRNIINELEQVKSPYFVSTRYMNNELFVDTSQSDVNEFPVVVMDWADGTPLNKFVEDNLSNKYALELLVYNFCQLGEWLLRSQLAHGDIESDNIIVCDDYSLILVDYDSMYIPAFEGTTALEIGNPNFQHPMRSFYLFNRHIDDFSIAVITLSLKALVLNPALYKQFNNYGNLIMSYSDYVDLKESDIFMELLTMVRNKDFAVLLSQFILSYSNIELYPNYLNISTIVEPIRSNITDDDIKNSYIDKNGVRYSNDDKRLLKFPENSTITHYTIPDGVEVICDWAFCKKSKKGHLIGMENPKSIDLPTSLKMIGNMTFGCLSLSTIIIPDKVKYIGNYAFAGCDNLTQIKLPSNCDYLGNHAFYRCSKLIDIRIPTGIDTIEDHLFCECESLDKVHIPHNVKTIKDSAFAFCFSLKTIKLSNNIKEISKDAFYDCSKKSIYDLWKHQTPLERIAIYSELPYQPYDILTVVSDCSVEFFFDNMNGEHSPRFVFEKSEHLGEDIFHHH